MTSLLGRLLPLFVGARRVEDLFTEAVARLFERRPELCLSWLDDLDLITSVSGEDQRYICVTIQKSFVALEEHGSASRPDLIVAVYHAVEDAELESSIDVVMVESKIGSWEGQEQLRRYAEHLDKMTGTRTVDETDISGCARRMVSGSHFPGWLCFCSARRATGSL